MNATSNNNTIINNEVSKPILKKLKEPNCSTSMSNKMNKATSNDNTMTNNATLPEWTLYRKFILYQFAKNVPDEGLRMNEDDMDEFVNRIFNTYNQDVRDEVQAKEEYTKEEMEHYNNVMDEAMDEFGYELIKGKNHTEKMELFIYLEAKKICVELYERQLKIEAPPTAEEQQKHKEDQKKLIIQYIVDKHRDVDACFRELFITLFNINPMRFDENEVSDDIDGLFGKNENPFKDAATIVINDAIKKHYERFGKTVCSQHEYLIKERKELIRKRDCDARIIAELTDQLNDYKENGCNEEEMEEKLQEKEQEVLEGLYSGGEFDEKYYEIIKQGKEEVYYELRMWAKRGEEDLEDC
jgi:hypothetical protein